MIKQPRASLLNIAYARRNARDIVEIFDKMTDNERTEMNSSEFMACLWAGTAAIYSDDFTLIALEIYKVSPVLNLLSHLCARVWLFNALLDVFSLAD